MVKNITGKILSLFYESKTLLSFKYEPNIITQQEFKLSKLHNVLIMDVSYSMENSIKSMIEQVKNCILQMNENDYVSVIAFSDENYCKTIVSGEVHLLKNVLINYINEKNIYCNGCTCFTNPMKALYNTCIANKENATNNINVLFYTDGSSCCNKSVFEDETDSIEYLDKLIDNDCNLINFSAIGFGNYVSEEYLYKLVNKSQFGRYILSNNIKDYSIFFTFNYNIAKETVNDPLEIKLLDENKNVILPDENAFILYQYGANGIKLFKDSLNISSINDKKNRFNIIIPENCHYILINDEIIETKFNRLTSSVSMEKILFGFIKELYYNRYSDKALSIALYLQDRYFIKGIMQSYTLSEKAELQNILNKAYNGKKYRFKDGHFSTDEMNVINNNYSILQLLSDLSEAGFKYIPVSSKNYKRVSSKTTNEMNDLFIEDYKNSILTNMSDLQFNESRLNISIPYTINGSVYIQPEDQKKYSLPEFIQTKKYRNQTLIFNGQLNITSFKVEIPEDYDGNVYISDGKFRELSRYLNKCPLNRNKRFYNIDFEKNPLPVISRKDVKNILNEDELLEIVYNLTTAKAKQKVFNAKIDDSVLNYISRSNNDNPHNLNEEQLLVLKEKYGLNSKLEFVGLPKVEKGNDKFNVATIEFGIKGSSSIPSISAYEKKIESGKPLNLMEDSMRKAFDIINNPDYTQKDLIFIKKYNKELIAKLSKEISLAKISMYLTGKSWTKFIPDDKGENEIYTNNEILKDITMVIKVKRKEIEI